ELQRIFLAPGSAWNCKISHSTRQDSLQPRGFAGGTKAAIHQQCHAEKGENDKRRENQQQLSLYGHTRLTVRFARSRIRMSGVRAAILSRTQLVRLSFS